MNKRQQKAPCHTVEVGENYLAKEKKTKKTVLQIILIVLCEADWCHFLVLKLRGDMMPWRKYHNVMATCHTIHVTVMELQFLLQVVTRCYCCRGQRLLKTR